MKNNKYDEAIAAIFYYIIQPALLLAGIIVFVLFVYESIAS